MRLGGEVHDGVALRNQAVDELGMADVAVDELDLVLDGFRLSRLSA